MHADVTSLEEHLEEAMAKWISGAFTEPLSRLEYSEAMPLINQKQSAEGGPSCWAALQR